jgi:hypothetical protein
MKSHRLLLIIAALFQMAACQKRMTVSCPVLPIPPADARSPRYTLPLDGPNRDELVQRLTYGLNERNRIDHLGADSDVKVSYEKSLGLLAEPNHLLRKDLEDPRYKAWLSGPLLKQVVDARDPSPPDDLHAPVAASDGRYWWIFYPDEHDRLTAVMAVKLNACQNLKEAER